MRRRSRAREVALQLLFQRDNNLRVARPDIERFVHGRLRDVKLEEFCLRLFDGVIAAGASVDDAIGKAAENWQLRRMAAIDRSLLRLGTFELSHETETPVSVVINETIELAKRFGTADSPGFVNGVLDRIYRQLQATANARCGPKE